MVVKKSSATLGYPGEMILPLNTDHHMICKYRSRLDANYTAFLRVIGKLVLNATRGPFWRKHRVDGTPLALETEKYQDQWDFGSLPALLPGTCEWIHSDPTFSSWVAAQESRPRVLWLCGLPGSGKSMLSAFVTQHISMRTDCNLCFFAAPHTLEAYLSPEMLLRSLSQQLSAQLPELRYTRTLLTHRRIGLNCSSWYIFWRILIESFRAIELKTKTYLIVDDVDKFQDSDSFLLALEEHSTVELPLCLLVVSEIRPSTRPSNTFKCTLAPYILDLSLLEGVRNDIRLVVTQKVERLRGLDNLKPDIAAHILDISNGNFLCADLLYKQITKCRRKEELQTILNQPCRDVARYYELIEMDLVSKWTVYDKRDAQVLMPFILHSFAPLTVEQLDHGVRLMGVEFLNIRDTITQVCKRFVSIDKKSQVRLVHTTAQQFILDQKSVLSVDPALAHRTIFMSCLSCLDNVATTSSSQQGDSGSFQKYARKFWFRHLERCGPEGSPSVPSTLATFFKGKGILSWILLVSRAQELQDLIVAALSINQFIAQARNNPVASEDIFFLERCSVDLCMMAERFSKPLTFNPEVIMELLPLFCPVNSFIRPLAQSSSVSVAGIPFLEWDNYLAAFTVGHDLRGTGITCTENRFAISTSTQEGMVLIYTSPKMNSNCTLIHGERIMTLQFSRSGNKMATYGSTKTTLWDLSTKQSSQTFSNPPNTTVLAFDFVPDDCAIFTFSDDFVLRKMILGSTNHDWESINLGAHYEPTNRWLNPSCASFDHQTKRLVVGFQDNPLEVWDLQSLVRIAKLGGSSCPQNNVMQICWCPHPDRIIARQGNGSLTILDLNRLGPIAACIDAVSTMSCSATSEFLVTGDSAGTIKVRRASDLTLLCRVYGTESSNVELSVAPISGKIYSIQGSKCMIWEPSLLAMMARDKQRQIPQPSLGYPSQGTDPNKDHALVTALATCIRSGSYCAGYTDGKIRVTLSNGAKPVLDLSTRVRIEHLVWSPDERQLAIADLGARVFITSVDNKSYQLNLSTSFRLQSAVKQFLFQRTSSALLVVTEGTIITLELSTRAMKSSNHSLGSHARWINHPAKDDLVLGFGSEKIQICRWYDHMTISSISLDNSMADLAFGLQLLDFVRTESSSTTLHPLSAECQVKRVFASPEASMLLLVTTRHARESISCSQFLQIPITELNDAITRPHGVVRPTPLIESLSDIMVMPLGFLPCNAGQGCVKQDQGSCLVFLSKDNWICSSLVNPFSGQGPIRKHIFLPDDWLAAENVGLIRLRLNEIYIPRLEHVVVIRNAFDVWY